MPYDRVLGVLVLVGLLREGLMLFFGGAPRLARAPHRGRLAGTLEEADSALKGWLLGQGVAMAVIGTTVAIGLAAWACRWHWRSARRLLVEPLEQLDQASA